MTLEEKKNVLIGKTDKSIESINKQIEQILEEREMLLRKKESLKKFDYFTKEEAKEIVEYLVSKAEDKKYSVEKLHVDTFTKSDNQTLVFEYSFLYLVEESKKEQALEEIKEKYSIKEKDGKNIISSSSIMKEDYISDNYVKLAFYNRHSDKLAKFTDQKEPHVITINIQDNRFEYINEFINIVLDERLNRNVNKLPIEKIINMANNFILGQKNNKELLLESE